MKGWKRIMSLSTPWLAALFVLVGVVGVGGSVIAYRTYDWVEHDNDFCLSCHLMVEPYEMFAESAHRDLGCKSCHTPTLVQRSQMGLTQFVENPDSISVHAEVPNEKCTSCHIDDNPEKWTQIANSPGHRVHFESTDTILEGLQCVECHQSSLHEFTATDQTCAQSGCHTEPESAINLGRMGDFTIHCVACHTFSEPPPDTTFAAAQAAVQPSSDDCLSCHVMRTLVEIPEDEPHEAVCGSCHNPHEQETPQQAVETCANAGCHEEVLELTPFHRGIDHAIDDCSACHTAHDFGVEGSDCLSCHSDIYEDPAPGDGRMVIAATGGIPGSGQAHPSPPRYIPTDDPRADREADREEVPAEIGRSPSGPGAEFHRDPVSPSAWREIVETPVLPASHLSVRGPAPQETTDRPFRHSTHREVDCTGCHVSTETHGELTADDPVDCATCHHTPTRVETGGAVVPTDCSACHAPVERPERADLAATWEMEFSVGVEDTRQVPFAHVSHTDVECASCHTDGIDRPVVENSCDGCHVEHHEQPTVQCVSCHEPPPDDAHDVNSHLTCAGSGCHTDLPLPATPRQGREACLSCHTDLIDHRPEGACVDCHQLPAPAGGGP